MQSRLLQRKALQINRLGCTLGASQISSANILKRLGLDHF